MRKPLILVIFAAALVCSCCGAPSEQYPTVYAHRGCWLAGYVPENSLDAVEMAARYGYPTVECDVKLTADSVHVLMHDPSINRTMRRAADYSEMEEKLKVKDMTFDDLRGNYVLASTDPARRAQIPTFEEFMHKCVECGIRPILHCDLYSGYEIAQKIAPGDSWIAFTTRLDVLQKVRALNPDVLILYAIDEMSKADKADPRNVIARLETIGRPCGISSMSMYDTRAEMCAALLAEGYEIQSSIVPTPKDMAAIDNGCTILLTDFAWFQTAGRKPAEVFKAKPSVMTEGETVEKAWDRLEYGAVVVNVACEGEFELTVNGRRYPISRETAGPEKVGVRMYDETPSVSLKCLRDGSRIESLKVEVYSL